MKHIKWIGLAIAALTIATLACGGSQVTPTPPPTATPRPTAVPPTATPKAEATGSLEIVNNSGSDIYYVYISLSSSDQWGDDQLGDNIISDGESHTITDIAFGTYDLKAEASNNNEIATEMGVVIDGDKTWTVTGAGPSGATIRQWATGARAGSEWGSESWTAQQATGAPDTEGCGDYGSAWASSGTDSRDWIELTYDTPVYATEINIYQTYNPDQVVRVELVDLTAGYHTVYEGTPETTDCPYVLSIPVGNANYLAAGVRINIDQSLLGTGWNEIDAVELVGVAEGGGGTASLEIVNESSIDIWYVKISPSDSNDWGDDWLGAEMIPAGESYTITGIEVGTYDLKAEDLDGNELATEMGVVFDDDQTWTITGAGGGGPGEEISQWASGAAAGSEWGSVGWTAQQAIGAPDVESCGDDTSAWASSGADTREWIELTYDTPVYATEINIYQTYNPNQVVQVELVDTTAGYHVVYKGQPEATDCPYVLSIPVGNANYLAAGVRINIDQSLLGTGWNEIDAVELIGVAGE